jgi:hypothetical protein
MLKTFARAAIADRYPQPAQVIPANEEIWIELDAGANEPCPTWNAACRVATVTRTRRQIVADHVAAAR